MSAVIVGGRGGVLDSKLGFSMRLKLAEQTLDAFYNYVPYTA